MPEHCRLPAAIVPLLLQWFDRHARVLPWRENPTPYRVWISEIMLQQTRVEAVKPYFERFLAALPTVEALAAVPEERLLKLWEGLGYYNRARNLQKAARRIVAEFGGEFPADADALRSLPGIGEYTAGAIASIAFGLPCPAVDGNVLRVAVRLLDSRADIAKPPLKAAVTAALAAIFPTERCSAFTQSLMELGATVCLPNGAPLCAQCPVAACCAAQRHGTAATLPVKTAAKARRTEVKTILLLECEGQIALRRRPATGVLAGMWEFPHCDGTLTAAEATAYLRELGVEVLTATPTPAAKHIFTHLEWQLTGWRLSCRRTGPTPALHWVTPTQLRTEISLPSAFKAFRAVLN